jgi:hypothetical protein
MSLKVVKEDEKKLKVRTPQEAAKELERVRKFQAEKVRGDNLIAEYKKVLEDLMNEYIGTLTEHPDEDKKRFKEYALEWKKVCVKAMKTHRDLKLHKDGFSLYWQIINQQTKEKIKHDREVES